MPANNPSFLSRFGPGILVAATGVGAGDLITASLAGSEVGLVVVWAVIVGALLKWGLNEGIARWQFATETTLLEGWMDRIGSWFSWIFIGYFLIWSFAVGGALASACGIAGDALFRVGDVQTSRIVWGVAHSLVGLIIAWKGGFKSFERVMSVCTGLMVASVFITAGLIIATADAGSLAGIIPEAMPRTREDWLWMLGVLGGIGGTVTMLAYGYWIREAGRAGVEGLRESRFDLAFSYTLTALFGCAMVVIGSRISGTGKGAAVALQLAGQLELTLGPAAKWTFLIGFWAAVFTSLLGVWQSAPYLFADFLRVRKKRADAESRPASHKHVTTHRDRAGTRERKLIASLRRSRSYRWYLVAIATVPLVLLGGSVKEVQILYATLGAAFMPLTALTLLIMNNRTSWVGAYRNRTLANALLVITLAVFTYLAVAGVSD